MENNFASELKMFLNWNLINMKYTVNKKAIQLELSARVHEHTVTMCTNSQCSQLVEWCGWQSQVTRKAQIRNLIKFSILSHSLCTLQFNLCLLRVLLKSWWCCTSDTESEQCHAIRALNSIIMMAHVCVYNIEVAFEMNSIEFTLC